MEGVGGVCPRCGVVALLPFAENRVLRVLLEKNGAPAAQRAVSDIDPLREQCHQLAPPAWALGPLTYDDEPYGMRRPTRPQALVVAGGDDGGGDDDDEQHTPAPSNVPHCADEDIMCGVCREMLWMPVVLACGHVFCRVCLMGRPHSDSSAGCPYCALPSCSQIPIARGQTPVCTVLQHAVQILRPDESAQLRDAHYDTGDVPMVLRRVFREMRKTARRGQRGRTSTAERDIMLAADAAGTPCPAAAATATDEDDDDGGGDDDDGGNGRYYRSCKVAPHRVLHNSMRWACDHAMDIVFSLLTIAWAIAVSTEERRGWATLTFGAFVLALWCFRTWSKMSHYVPEWETKRFITKRPPPPNVHTQRVYY